MTRETRLLTPAELAGMNLSRAKPREPDVSNRALWLCCVVAFICALTACAVADHFITAHVAAQVWGE
jgi:hypothetical protein